MVKLVYVIENFPGESEYFILNEIIELKKQGVDIFICGLRKPKCKFHVKEFRDLNLSVWYLPAFLLYFLFAFFFSNYKKNIQIIWHLVIASRWNLKTCLKKMNYFFIALYFSRKVAGKDVSHVHAHFAFISTDVANILAKILGVKYSFTAHAQDIFLNLKNIPKKIEEASFVVTCT
jgi:colanic acid/amylovoran biosynthesis glycosyltransferase